MNRAKKTLLLNKAKLVCLVLVAKSVDLQTNTFALKGEIDQLVAPRQMYGLSEDGVRIVEGR